jgi:hypothetical protein
MAAGDPVGATYSIAAGARVNYQPAAGVVILMTAIAGYTDVMPQIYDGTNAASVLAKGTFSASAKVIITNTLYFSWNNTGTGAEPGGFTGIQIK